MRRAAVAAAARWQRPGFGRGGRRGGGRGTVQHGGSALIVCRSALIVCRALKKHFRPFLFAPGRSCPLCLCESVSALVPRCERMSRRRASFSMSASTTGPASLPPLPFETRLTPGFVRRHPSPTPPGVQPLVLALDVTVLAGRDPDEDERTSRTGRSSRSRTRDTSSAVGGGSAAGQRCEFYVTLVCETPAGWGPCRR